MDKNQSFATAGNSGLVSCHLVKVRVHRVEHSSAQPAGDGQGGGLDPADVEESEDVPRPHPPGGQLPRQPPGRPLQLAHQDLLPAETVHNPN